MCPKVPRVKLSKYFGECVCVSDGRGERLKGGGQRERGGLGRTTSQDLVQKRHLKNIWGALRD